MNYSMVPSGFQRGGFPQQGYPRQGAPQGYPQQGFPQQGQPRRQAVKVGASDVLFPYGTAMPPVYPATYGYPMGGGDGGGVMGAALNCMKKPDGSWDCSPGGAMAPAYAQGPGQQMGYPQQYGGPQQYPGGQQMLNPNCPPVYYPLQNDCNELVLPPVNPCDPFSLFCSLFGRRRGVKKTTIGVPITTLPAQSSATIQIPVGMFFRACSLRVPSDIINSNLFITSILAGTSPQIQGPVPARIFSEVAVEKITLAGDPVGFGQGLSLTAANQSLSPIIFSGAFEGIEFDC